jgi:hypothetical protein
LPLYLMLLVGVVVALVLDPVSPVTVGISATALVKAIDQYGNVNPTFNSIVTLATPSGSSITGLGQVTLASGLGSRSVSSTLAQTAVLELTDSETIGLNITSTRQVIFRPGCP